MSLSHPDVIAMMEPVGQITQLDGQLVVDITTKDPRPAVYCWASGDQVLYVGKAGRGLRVRAQQWRGGFGSTSGRGWAQAQSLLALSRPVDWMAMWPEPLMFRGHAIAGHSSVEEWLINTIDPLPILNRQK